MVHGYSIKRTHTEENPYYYTVSNETTLELSLHKNLMPGRNYTFRIAAYNRADIGPYSPPIKVGIPAEVRVHFIDPDNI